MIIFHGSKYLPFHITIPKIDDIKTIDCFKYTCQSLNSTGDKTYVGDVIFFYFNDDGKLDMYYIYIKIPCYL